MNMTQELISPTAHKTKEKVLPSESLSERDRQMWTDAIEQLHDLQSKTFNYQSQQFLKRCFDVIAALLGVLAISPLLLVIALAVKLTSEGPVLYKSRRTGRNSQSFYMLKFRTMGVDADARRASLREEAKMENGLFKLENDPRVTRIGRFLRAFSLDELPQLFNVLRGEMSLVGPRPLMPDESTLFKKPYTLRFMVYPGITGKWQVSGRSNLTFAELCQLEMNYVLQWNIINDLKILLMTFPAVLASKGAY
jgi:lipopolysaccharide/colanic/teichoic acid biosynthesis glycosyltransferase